MADYAVNNKYEVDMYIEHVMTFEHEIIEDALLIDNVENQVRMEEERRVDGGRVDNQKRGDVVGEIEKL